MHRYLWRYVLHLLIGAYIIGALMWSLPAELPLKTRTDAFVSPIFQRLGLWQNWQMFAPTPRNEDIYVDAMVQLADGRVLEVNLSRMSEMSLFDRYRKERWRKLLNDYIRSDEYHRYWPMTATWLARAISEQEQSAVTHLELWRHWRAARPGLLARTPVEEGWQQQKFFDYTIPMNPAISTTTTLDKSRTPAKEIRQ